MACDMAGDAVNEIVSAMLSEVVSESKITLMNVHTLAQIIVDKRYRCAWRVQGNTSKLGVKVVVSPGTFQPDTGRLIAVMYGGLFGAEGVAKLVCKVYEDPSRLPNMRLKQKPALCGRLMVLHTHQVTLGTTYASYCGKM